MAAPTLAAKLFIPVPRPRLVARPHLVERLSAGLAKPLTLICAPAGFGKTTLLSEWRAGPGCQVPVAWLTVDEHDNDPVRFLTYLIRSLDQVRPGVGETALALLQSGERPPAPVVLAELLNDLSAIDGPFVLVLDDYHAIQTDQNHQALAFLVKHLPPHMHLVIASRIDPPLPLSRLRASDQLTEIRAADLRFSREEARAFFTEVMDLDLQLAEVAALERRTEGWIAGLQLAALSLHNQADRAGFIAAFTGSHRYVFDYLIEEVLELQPEDLRSFLLDTAILERMTGPLCERLTGRRDSAQVLANLERLNLFVVPLDAERKWYRYHHLFGQLLRSRLQDLQPERVPELHLQACAWYEANGFAANAVQHALAAHATDRAASLIEKSALDVYMRGEYVTLLRWCQALDETVLQAHPYLDVLYAAALHQVGQVDVAEARLNRIARQELAPQVKRSAAAVQAGVAFLRGNMKRAADFAQEALTIPETPGPGAQATFSPVTALFASGTLAAALTMQGKIEEAIATCQQALALARSLTLKPPWSVTVGGIHLQLSLLHYEQNELEAAAQHAAAHLPFAAQAHHKARMAYGYAVLARIRQAQGRPHEALEHLQTASRLVERWHASPAMARAMSQLVQVWLMQGDLDTVRRWIQDYQVCKEAAAAGDWLLLIQPVGDLALARAWLALGQPNAAFALLEPLRSDARAGAQWGRQIEIISLQALAWQAQGQLTAALQTLDQALALGETAGYFRLFVDGGADMAALLVVLLRARRLGQLPAESGASTEYIRRLLAACAEIPAATPASTEDWAPMLSPPALLLEPLTERERDVLRLVVTGCSNPEIGQRLFITTGTVKRHINSIFSKLDVRTRAQAIACAREFNLA